jgi:two-component system OmpR family response regulator
MADATSLRDAPGRSAFVLDDEAGVRVIILHALRRHGFDALEFATPDPMLTRLAAAPPDLLVLDLELGQSDAVEVMGRLAGLKYGGSVLLISGRDEGTLAEIARIGEGQGLAMLPPLRKPFRSKQLVERLAALPRVAQITPTAGAVR